MDGYDDTDNVCSEGRSFGKGRGYRPAMKTEDSSDGGGRGRGGRGRGDFRGGRGGGRGRYGNDGDRDGGDRGSWKNNDDRRGRDEGGWSSNRNNDNGNDGGWGGEKKDDGWGGSNNDRNNDGDRRGGGGFNDRGENRRGGRRNDDDGGGWDSNDRNNDGDRRGGGGYRGGRGGGRRNDDDGNNGDDWGSNDRNNDGDRRGGGGYRGGRGGGRGGRGGFDDGDNKGGGGGWNDNKDGGNDGDEPGDGEERKPITYVPKDRTEEELFSETGIERGINFDKYESIEVKITGQNAPRPINTFAEANLRELILNNLKKCRYDKPTPIQKNALPVIMAGRDLMATAQTGSGKTAAFLLPIIHSIMSGECESEGGKCCSPNALVLSPTRELAIQIRDNAKLYTAQSSVKVEILYGGVSTRHQGSRLMLGCNILIATPGRLCDFLNRGWVKFDAIRFLVLDEADRMLDMGFIGKIDEVVNHESMTPQSERQTLMFSATFSDTIQKLAAKYLRRDYIFLAVGVVGGACTDVAQNFVSVDRRGKKDALLEILRDGNCQGTLVFCDTQKQTDFLATFLSQKDIKTTSIHGARQQHQREEALYDFKSKRMSVLVATNVAARGLDIPGVKHVVNYDLPKEIEEYVHRIGRTGRLGNKGKATSLYDTDANREIADELVRILKQANQNVPDFIEQDSSGSSGGGYEQSGFGGTDYRNSGDTGSGNNAGAQEDEW